MRAEALRAEIPQELQAAYFELVEYPVRGAWMINEYQLLARTSMAHAAFADAETALADAARATEMFNALNDWTDKYNNELLDGKWGNFFRWTPYHWYYTTGMTAPVCTEEVIESVRKGPEPGYLDVEKALTEGIVIESAGASLRSSRAAASLS